MSGIATANPETVEIKGSAIPDDNACVFPIHPPEMTLKISIKPKKSKN